MEKNRTILFYTIYWLLYIDLIQRYVYSHELLTIVPDVLIFYCAIRTAHYRMLSDKYVIKELFGRWLPVLIILLLSISVVGAIVNLVPIPSYLWGLRGLLRYVLLVWCVLKNCKSEDVGKFKHIIYRAYCVNLIFCLVQYLQGQEGDLMGGTFLWNGPLMLITLVTFIFASGDYFYGRISLKLFIIIWLSWILIAIFAEIKMMYFLFPLIFYVCYVLFKKISVSYILSLVVAFFLLVPTMKFFISMHYDEYYVNKVFNRDFIDEETTHAYGFKKGGFNRATAVALTDSVILRTTSEKWLGHGLGRASGSSYFSTNIYKRYNYTSYWNFSTSYCLVEIGWTGFILYGLCFLFLLYRFALFYKLASEDDGKYWSVVGITTVIVTFILCWYNDLPYVRYLLIYFLWGISWVAIRNSLLKK